MAVILDAYSGAHLNDYGTSSVTFAHTVAGPNETLLVHCSVAGLTAITYGGAALTLIASTTGANPASSVWGLLNPPQGTNNIVVTAPSVYTKAWCEATSWIGADQSALYDSVVPYNNGSASAVVTITASTPAGGVAVGMLSGSDVAATISANSPATQLVSRNTYANLTSLAWTTDATAIAWTRSAGMQTSAEVVVLKPAATGGDITPPVHTGSITASAITSTGYTLAWPAASDAVGVTGYEYSLNSGTSYAPLGVVLSVAVTGRTPGTTDDVRVRAFDAAGNRSTALSSSVTLAAGATGTITFDPLKNNAGTLLASTTCAVHVYALGGTLVVSKAAQIVNASGVVAVADAAIAPGTEYRCVIVLSSGAEGMARVVAA